MRVCDAKRHALLPQMVFGQSARRRDAKMSTDLHQGPFQLNSHGIHIPRIPIAHRADEYDPAGFEIVRNMQQPHFWYRGLHRALLRALQRKTLRPNDFDSLRALRRRPIGFQWHYERITGASLPSGVDYGTQKPFVFVKR
jgi:hypothetical protein